MFTGITEQVGRIESLHINANGGALLVHLPSQPGAHVSVADGMKLGDSISVNGCCLTVTHFDPQHFSAQLSGETLQRTNFGEKKNRDLVNLERPLAAGGHLGGHFVQGHVDGIGRVTRLAQEGDGWWLSVRIPENLRRYIAEKGSIAIDGVSLTVAKWRDGIVDIAIVPFTYENTNVRMMAVNDAVNIETDILAKYVESLLKKEEAATDPRITVEQPVEEGF
jgi:riboflavin synthase